MELELTQAMVEQWIALSDTAFTNRMIWQELGIDCSEDKHHLKVILNRLKKKGIIQSSGEDGRWRKVDDTAEELNWWDVDPNVTLPLEFPFELENLVELFPKSVVIVAGASNAGKTAFCYNTIALNMHKFPVDLYNNETSPEQMNKRFAPLMIPRPPPFKTFQRYDRYQDIIDPDHLSVIDYLAVDSDFYMIGAEISAIWKKLNKGVAVIALQKPPGRDDAFGGSMVRNRASLYVTLDKDRMKILKAKAWKDPQVNPNGKQWTFRLEHGIHFVDVLPYQGFDNQ
jgi:hypothetical protein